MIKLKKKTLLLVNPKARRGTESLDAVIGRLHKGGLDVTVEPFSALPEIGRDIARLRDSADMIVLCGGDGSISSGAMAVMESGLPLGIMPLGTANDLARTLGIPMDLAGAADVILAGNTRRIDLGSVNGHAFFNVASIGLSADLAAGIEPGLKKRFGRFGYALGAARVLMKARPFRATIREKGERIEVKTFQIAVGNGRHYGGGNVVEASAEIDDGHLDLYSLELHTVWQLALMLRSFRSGEHGAWSEVATARGTEFEIRTRRPMAVNADGELIAETPAIFKVHPGAVSVLAPPDAGTD
jgi:diacylglycerol kinase (ATP)